VYVNAEDDPFTAPPSVPSFAARASTSRIPAGLMSTLRQTARTFHFRPTHPTPGWAEPTRDYAAIEHQRVPAEGKLS
jgi:hypothetical protein